MKTLEYDPITKTMKHPIEFTTDLDGVSFENKYYETSIEWRLDYYTESNLLGYVLLPEYDYFSITLKSPVDGYVNATPCIFYNRKAKLVGKHSFKFEFDSERNKDDKYFEEYPYVVFMLGCDDGHLGFAVKNIEEAKQILDSINSFDMLYLQDINELIHLECHN